MSDGPVSEGGRLPYPGLRAYERDETDLFFGREGCVDEMVDRLAAFRFLAVLGASGSGKSSLVRTGLLDALEIGLHASAGPLWVIADCHPGGSAIRNLATALLSATGKANLGPDAVDALDTFLRRGPRSIIEWVNDGNLPEKHNLLVLVDQFEELFRYGDYAGREEAEAFAALLLESAHAAGRIHVVITMRSEYLGACALIPGLAEQINSSLYLTRRMTREECREAIEGPAAVMGFAIEPALVSRILNDLAALAPWERDRENSQLQRLSRQADQLPLMQHALSRLWQLAKRRSETATLTLTLQDYLDIGQLQGALDQHANEVEHRLSDAAKPLVRRVFRALVAGSDLSDAVRKPMRLTELAQTVSADIGVVREIVDAFRARDCNFLRPSDGHALSDDTVVDISHESLIRQWGELSKWFGEEAQSAALWGRLIYSEEHHADGTGELQSGLDLANALAWWEREQPTEGWAKGHGGRFSRIERYLRASREAEERQINAEQQRTQRERRRLRTAVVAIAGFALLCLGLAAYSWHNNVMLNEANKMARSALGSARAANDFSMAAADRFVVGDAERLQQMRGIPYDEVRSRLSDGKAFLDKLAEHPADQRHIGLSQAKLAAVDAATILASGQPEDALRIATATESQLESMVTDQDTAADRDQRRLEIYGTIIIALIDLGKYDEALTHSKHAVAIADALPGADWHASLEQGEARFFLSYSLSWVGDYAGALEIAKQCIDYLDRPAVPKVTERNFFSGRCHAELSFSASKLNQEGLAEEHDLLAVREFDLTPDSAKPIPMLMAESTVLQNIGADYDNRAHDFAKAEEYDLKSEKLLALSDVDIQQNVRLRAYLMDRRNQLGELYSEHKNEKAAIEWFGKAVTIGFLDDKWRSLPTMATRLDTSLHDLENSLASLEWRTNPEILSQFEAAVRKDIPVRAWLISSGNLKWCQGCDLLDKQADLTALIKFDRIRGEDRYADAIRLADEIIGQAKATLANPPSERFAINARRAWFWTVHDLIQDPEDMPSVTHLTDPAEQANGQIRRLTDSRERLTAFLQAMPSTWFAEQALGRVNGNLAKLFAALGRKEDAVAAAEAGAAMFDRDSIELLAGWYRTGSGPVARNPAKADTYNAILTSRRWELTRFTVKARPLYRDGDQEFDEEASIEDPRYEGDDPVARCVSQLENVQGVKVRDAAKQELYKILKDATDKKTSFSETLIVMLGTAAAPDAIRAKLAKSADDDNASDAANELIRQWRLNNGRSTIETVLSGLVKDTPDRNYVPFLGKVADATINQGELKTGAAVLDTLLSRADLPPEQIVAFRRLRGIAREYLKDFDGAEDDYSVALTLSPDNSEVLNLLGYLWVENDRNLDGAMILLTRAVGLAPDDPLIRDSLGWAEVKVGKTEEGLRLLQSAAAQRPDEAEVLTHLGDAYRRLGRDKEAAATLARAAAIAKDDNIVASIRLQQKLLNVPP